MVVLGSVGSYGLYLTRTFQCSAFVRSLCAHRQSASSGGQSVWIHFIAPSNKARVLYTFQVVQSSHFHTRDAAVMD